MKNKWVKRMLALTMVTVMTAGMMSGCGGKSGAEETGTKETGVKESGAEASGEKEAAESGG